MFEPGGLIHGRAIGASHARLARRWVSRLKNGIVDNKTCQYVVRTL